MSSKYVKIGAVLIVVILGLVIFLNKGEEIEEVVEEVVIEEVVEIIGYSVEGRKIEAHTFGEGDTEILFVGGIHGGYEWNSILLAYELIDYLDNEGTPEKIKVIVIPGLNPDGTYSVIGKEGRFDMVDIPTDVDQTIGRFNANEVDLNRNFDCKWKPESTWRGNVVSAGTEAFSEPEAAALRDFVLGNDIDAVIFFHSQANTVYASECEDGVIPETATIMNLYADAANYNSVEVFDAYEVTGDAEGWLASIGIPAITVELETHETVEWLRNLQGIRALFEYYSEK